MRKVLIFGVMAALAFGAWADNSYFVRVNTGLSVKGGGQFSEQDVDKYYSAYSLTDAQAAKLMGIEYTGQRIAAADVRTWLNQNYLLNAWAWQEEGTKANNYYHFGVSGVDPYPGNRMYTDFDLGGKKYATAEAAFEANRLIILFYHGPKDGKEMNGYRIVGLDNTTPLTGGMYAVTSVSTGDWAGDGTHDQGWVLSEGPAPIPEPTSALLMLLGVAGLALKRKCA